MAWGQPCWPDPASDACWIASARLDSVEIGALQRDGNRRDLVTVASIDDEDRASRTAESARGLEDENLIAVCHECHVGFDPHYQPGLFWLPDGHAGRALEQHSTDAHNQRVKAYRRLSAGVFEALDGRD